MRYKRRAVPQLEAIATKIRADYPRFDGKRLLIEDVVRGMGYTLFPIDGLQEEIGVEAYIAKKPNTIIVERAEMDGGSPHYYFTLAEEVAHIHIHLNSPPPGVNGVKAIHEWVDSLSKADYQAFECDAKYLAGAILMPAAEFKTKFNDLAGIQTKALGKHSDRNTVIRYVLRQMMFTYMVSFNAAATRALNLNLISRSDLQQLQAYQMGKQSTKIIRMVGWR